jgi:hypothetical protein
VITSNSSRIRTLDPKLVGKSDPVTDPYQIVLGPQHCLRGLNFIFVKNLCSHFSLFTFLNETFFLHRILIWPDILLIQKPDTGYPVGTVY